MACSIFRIEMALDGKIDFVRKTNPWGTAETPEPEDDEALAAKIAAAFRSHKHYQPRPDAP